DSITMIGTSATQAGGKKTITIGRPAFAKIGEGGDSVNIYRAAPLRNRAEFDRNLLSNRECVGDQARLLALVAGERADRGAGTGLATCVGNFGAKERSQSRLNESPRAHVLRFFLAPDELRVFWKRLEHFAEPFLSEWIKLLDANEGCVVDFAFTAIFQ